MQRRTKNITADPKAWDAFGLALNGRRAPRVPGWFLAAAKRRAKAAKDAAKGNSNA
jgi:hypothetical protein